MSSKGEDHSTLDYQIECRHFSGYKPCKFKRSCRNCPHVSIPDKRILIVSLEALGAVLRTTCLLKPIRRKYPDAHVTWLTMPGAAALLHNNPLIDKIIKFDDQALPVLDHLEFDVSYIVDKSSLAGGLAVRIHSKHKLGFGLSSSGAIVPLNPEAAYQYRVGLDDNLKFYENQKPETQQITETMGFDWKRDPYILSFSDEERAEMQRMRHELLSESKGIIGYSTGCSLLYPYKKFTLERAIAVVGAWRETYPDYAVALFGGREDLERNSKIKEAAFSDDPLVHLTPCTEGLRRGMMWMSTADVMLTGCSLGLHISIALEKPVVTWFGVSCAQEIDLYDRGVKVHANVPCSPCWKRSCDKDVKCFDQVDLGDIVANTGRLLGA